MNDAAPTINALRSDEFTLRFRRSGTIHKVLKLLFTKDGSLALTFPYFPNVPGIVSLVTLRAGQEYPTNIDLSSSGKVTSHLVKYSHHESGEALFSQTGKVLTTIRKMSLPVSQYQGHLFTVQLQQVASFAIDSKGADDAPWDPASRLKARAVTLQWEHGDIDEGAMKLVARAFPHNELQRITVGPELGPVTTTVEADGTRSQGFLFAANLGNPSDGTIIILNAERVPQLTDEDGPHLTFIGGFDPGHVALDHAQDTSFLALNYPTDDFEELKRRIGSIDYQAR